MVLAVLLHVTVAIAATTAVYQVAERRQHVFAPPHSTIKIGGTLAAAAMTALTIWLCLR